MQRPAEFAGKSLKDVTPAELEKLMQQRHRSRPSARRLSSAGPPTTTPALDRRIGHENYNAKNSRAWMISDPPDGQMPALYSRGCEKSRRRPRGSPRRGWGITPGPSMVPEDLTLHVRCITSGFPAR